MRCCPLQTQPPVPCKSAQVSSSLVLLLFSNIALVGEGGRRFAEIVFEDFQTNCGLGYQIAGSGVKKIAMLENNKVSVLAFKFAHVPYNFFMQLLSLSERWELELNMVQMLGLHLLQNSLDEYRK